MKIIKSNGEETQFSRSNIVNAITKANMRVRIDERFTTDEIKQIAKDIETKCKSEIHILTTSDIQNMVEDALIAANKPNIVKSYITYRYQKALDQKKNTIDDRILSLINDTNEEIKQENSNKNPTIINVQRDYMAGEVSKDLSQRYLIPEDIYKAHKEGIIHFHDMDYFANKIHNCDLINLKDMFENETVLVNTKIEKPHRFSVACTIASQIAQQVSSSQYGGQSMYVSHLSPFVEETRKSLRKRFIEKLGMPDDEKLDEIVEKATILDVEDGIQTLMYQLNSLQGTNGQAPFITLFMYLDDVPFGKQRDDLALVCQKILEQRILGLKNPLGVYVTTAFPKILYVLDEDNINEDSQYFWLSKLSAVCTAHRMVPDYISAKKMKDLKGDVYPCMGCVAYDSNVKIKYNDEIQDIEIGKLYDLVKTTYPELDQYEIGNPNKYIDTTNIDLFVFDSNKSDFVKVYKVIKNVAGNIDWKTIILQDGHCLDCTANHIITTNKHDEIEVKDITDDKLFVSVDNKLVECEITSIVDFECGYDYSYDLETESEHFDVNGIYTHNCRSFLTPGYVEPKDPWKMTKKKISKTITEPVVYNSNKVFNFNEKEYNAKTLFDEYYERSKDYEEVLFTVDPLKTDIGNIIKVYHDANDYYIVLDETREYKVNTNAKYAGRWNQGVCTINLPDVALSSKKDMERFWYILEERLELCHRALRLRHERLRGVKSDVAPILWQNGALARLAPGETIDKLLYNGYSTISLGYVGLYECVKYMTGKDHWLDDEQGGALEFAKEVMQKLNDKCKQWKEIEHIDYSVYGTPEESTTQKFAQSLQRRFGIIKGITDKNYVTNSYHIPVFIKMNAFDKISYESPLQELSPGGAISYIEGPSLVNNINTVIALMKHFYENLVYGEINLKLDHCNACGFDGALDIKVFDDKPEFVCPQCGEREFDHTPSKLHFARRVCGYISTHTMCSGRKFDVMERVEHI